MHKLHFDTALLPGGWSANVAITIDPSGVISGIETGVADGTRVRGAAVPGLPNLHSHAFQRGMAGLTEHAGAGEDSFWTWRELMYRFLGVLSPDDVEAIAAQAYVEMLEAGFTSVGEFHYLHHDIDGRPYSDIAEMSVRHVAAAAQAGIGLTHLPVFYAHGGFMGAAPNPGQRRFLNDLDGFARIVERCRALVGSLQSGRVGIAPHSMRAATLDELGALMGVAHDGPIHIHVSEQTKEVDDCRTAHGTTPIALLADTVALDEHWCLIHATHATDAELRLMTESRVVAGLCPVTEANLGDGIFPAVTFAARRGRIGVGTDSNVAISGAGELRMLEYSQRLSFRRRNALAPSETSTGRTLWTEVVAGGAQALGLTTAGLRIGAAADILVIDTDDVAMVGRFGDRLLDALVFAEARRPIRDVWAAGRHVVIEGRHVACEAVERRFRATLARLLAAV